MLILHPDETSDSEGEYNSDDVTTPATKDDHVPPSPDDCVYFKKIYPQARTPSRGSPGAAGFDLYSISDTFIASMDIAKIQTGICISMPKHCYGRLAPRSGLSVVHRLHVLGGVIDPDYQGPICCVLQNLHPQHDVFLPAFSRVAQIIFERISTTLLMTELSDLNYTPTQRDSSGFGGASGLY